MAVCHHVGITTASAGTSLYNKEVISTLAGARIVAERIRQATHALRLLSESGTPITVTVSIGIAVYPSMAATQDALFEVADGALYEAKRGGKDRALTVAI